MEFTAAMTMKTVFVLRPALGLLMLGISIPAWSDSPALSPVAAAGPSYADLVDLAEPAQVVIRARPGKLVQLEPERARSVRQGWGRFYVEAKTEELIAGTAPLGAALTYLVDLPLDPKGKPPKFKKKSVILFARPVPGRPGEVQLVAPDAQLLWDTALDARLRGVLKELYAPGAPPPLSGVREASHVDGTLAGSGETQLFLITRAGAPAAATVTRQPGQAPQWSLSFGELVASAQPAPARETLAWYRLACFLPPQLPDTVRTAGSDADRNAAAQDYAWMMQQLGPCPRSRS